MVGRVGLEPTQDKPAHLQCAALAAGQPARMVMPAGLEPGITSLRGLRPIPLDEGTVW